MTVEIAIDQAVETTATYRDLDFQIWREIERATSNSSGRTDPEIWKLVLLSPVVEATEKYANFIDSNDEFYAYFGVMSGWITSTEEEDRIYSTGLIAFVKDTTYDRFAAVHKRPSEKIQELEKLGVVF